MNATFYFLIWLRFMSIDISSLPQNTKGGGAFPIYYNITMEGGGSLGTPNLYYIIYGRTLKGDFVFI